MKAIEKYWAQTRAKWEGRVADPYGVTLACGFCNFDIQYGLGNCEACPVVVVYGHGCSAVEVRDAYVRGYFRVGAEELSTLAAAIVQELDDKKEEFIAAMRKLIGGDDEDS